MLKELRYSRLIIFFILSVILLNSCQPKGQKLNDASSPLTLKIPWQGRGEKNYSIQNIEVKTLTHLSPLKGSAADLIINPDLVDNKISGSALEIKFTYDKENRIIPLNRLSAEALALYVHLENLYLWNQSLQMPEDLHKKITVGFLTSNNDNSESLKEKNNASFNSTLNAMLVYPYDEKGVPLSINGGVIAHEYFHSLFFKLMGPSFIAQLVKQQSSKKAETFKYMRTLFRGFNEGLADVWGWLYSLDENFILHSLVEVKNNNRKLNEPIEKIWTRNKLAENLTIVGFKESEVIEHFAYIVGTQVARMMYLKITRAENTNLISIEARKKWSQRMIDRIPYLAEELMKIKDLNEEESNQNQLTSLTPALFIRHLLFENEKLSDPDCDFWSTFFETSDLASVFNQVCSDVKVNSMIGVK